MPSLARAGVVLHAMQDAGFIDASTRAWPQATRPRIVARQRHAGLRLFRRLGHGAAERLCRRHGTEPVIVETSFDLDTQTMAEHAVAQGLAAEGAEVRRQPGGAGGDDAGRRGPRHGGRQRSYAEFELQPRHRCGAPARQRLQALRLSHRASSMATPPDDMMQ